MERQVRHNPGVLKQQNKPHKTGRHRSKGEILKTNKGKVGIKALTKRRVDNQNKNQRKNRMVQLRRNKREEIVNKKRCIGTLTGCPHIVSIIPLSREVNCHDVIEQLVQCDPEAKSRMTETNTYCLDSSRFKAKYNFMIPNPMNHNAIIDAVKITDTCVFVISSQNEPIDSFGESLLDLIYSFHLPTSMFVVQGLKSLPIKTLSVTKNDLQKLVESKVPETKLCPLDSESDALNILHKISQHKLKPFKFNDLRPYMLADKVEYEQDKLNPYVGTLKLTGYLRSRNLNANMLVHLPSIGTFQISRIEAIQSRNVSDISEESWELVQEPDAGKQESLEQVALYDSMNAEQTWPDEQELKEAEMKTVKKKVPKGTSDYQAAWILDSEEEEVTEEEDDEDEQNEEDEDEEEEDDYVADDEDEERIDDDGGSEINEDEMDTMTIDDEAHKYDEKVDYEEDEKTLEKIKLAKENAEFPDEVDTPKDQPARVRFQKYRGLKSFRTSPWDKYENLPLEYSKIFQFDDLKRTFKKVALEKLDGAEPGTYVRIHLKNVPQVQFVPGHPILMYGLLKHENKMSVMNLKLKRVNTNAYSLPIQAKETLVFHVGCRRFEAGAIYSQHTNGDKHKFERFMPTDTTTFVATIFAPITFAPASVLVYKKFDDGSMVLVATGSLLTVDPNRIILKRIVLSGHPYRVSKKNAVVRYMFFTPDDVSWFKPVELRTKWGRHGHIREALGTHGHMKCQFNDVIKSQDCVMMNLYKRVFPKWTYNEISNDFRKDVEN